MNRIEPIKFFFRKPKFPIIVDIEGFLICGDSASSLAKRIVKYTYPKDKSYNAIDSKGEGWSFFPEHWVISPLSIKKSWTKLEIVRLYNGRKNMDGIEKKYSEKSLSSKRLDILIGEIVELLK